MKTCTKCGLDKPASAFSVDRVRTDGRCTSCKACQRVHRTVNRERIAKQKKTYRTLNREAFAARNRKYVAANRDKRNAYQRALYAGSRDKMAVYYRAWRAENRERLRQCELVRNAANREEHNAHQRVYTRACYAVNPQKTLARNKLNRFVRLGQIDKPDRCEQCGKKCTGKQLHGHHIDYSRPLYVFWLCPLCHAAEHIQIREAVR